MSAPARAVVVCGTVEASCVCGEPPHHDGPHVCHSEGCDGSWTFDERGRFVVVRMPGLGPVSEVTP